jgi:hypothetical protein
MRLAQALPAAGGADGVYVLELAVSGDASLLAAAVSDFRFALFRLAEGGALAAAAAPPAGVHAAQLVHLSFPDADAPSLLLTGCADGALRMFDCRAPGGAPAAAWSDSRARRELSAAAAQPAGAALAAGAEDGAVLLWDRRRPGAGAAGRAPPLACFDESQSGQPVTVLAWHPRQARALVSAGADGLACVFDVASAADEDEALQAVLQVGSSVARLGWLGAAAEGLWATTCTEELSVWDWAAGERVALVPPPPACGGDFDEQPLGGTRAAAAMAAVELGPPITAGSTKRARLTTPALMLGAR